MENISLVEVLDSVLQGKKLVSMEVNKASKHSVYSRQVHVRLPSLLLRQTFPLLSNDRTILHQQRAQRRGNTCHAI